MYTDDYKIDFGPGISNYTLKELKEWNKFEGNPSNLSLPHPYWTIQCIINLAKDYERHNDNLQRCIKNSKAINFLYNRNTSLDDIKNRVNGLKIAVDILNYLNILYSNVPQPKGLETF